MKKVNVFLLGLLAVLLAMSLVFIGCGEGEKESIKNPDPPQGVTATSDSTNSITVVWGTVSGASGYNIYRSSALTEVFIKIGSSKSSVYTDTGLLPGTTYYYRVSAYTENGEGSQSYHTSATTKYGAPTGINATAVSESSITVSWNAVSNATYYYIYRSDISSGTYTQVGTSVTTSYTNTGLTPNTTYYYKVAVYTALGMGVQSNSVSAITKQNAPTGVTATRASSSSITVSWNAVSNATYYYVYRSDSSSGTYTRVVLRRQPHTQTQD
ncbi:hypothetical protein R84B8_02384 [Treponema sp. R8-4-B8]